MELTLSIIITVLKGNNYSKVLSRKMGSIGRSFELTYKKKFKRLNIIHDQAAFKAFHMRRVTFCNYMGVSTVDHQLHTTIIL